MSVETNRRKPHEYLYNTVHFVANDGEREREKKKKKKKKEEKIEEEEEDN